MPECKWQHLFFWWCINNNASFNLEVLDSETCSVTLFPSSGLTEYSLIVNKVLWKKIFFSFSQGFSSATTVTNSLFAYGFSNFYFCECEKHCQRKLNIFYDEVKLYHFDWYLSMVFVQIQQSPQCEPLPHFADPIHIHTLYNSQPPSQF